MNSTTTPNRYLLFCAVVLSAGLMPSAIMGQQASPAPTPPETRDDVIRINTDLAQTDVVVLDRAGRFVEGLQREQFELRVDKQPQTISFFDLVTSGSPAEDKQLAAARGKSPASITPGVVGSAPIEQRRTIGFFIDDMHMAAESVPRTRELLRNFIDNGMRSGDQVLIASSSGDLGFLQQFTESKEVLRAAVQRLRFHQQSRLDLAILPMSVYEALLINRGDFGMLNRKAIEVLSNSTTGSTPKMRLIPLMAAAQEDVRKMAAQLLRQATIRDSAVLQTLESLARSAAALRGRKLVFFVSDGFVLDNREPEVQVKLQRVIDASARSGVVIYTVDTRGLFMAFADASTEVVATETHSETLAADVRASQEVLRTLAADTGGRAILNSNDLEGGVSNVLQETSNYYLIGWRPEQISQGKPSFRRLEVSIKNRPELKVFARRGFYDTPPPELKAATGNSPSATPGTELNRALNSVYPRRDFRVSMYPAFTNNTEHGSVLTVSCQLFASDFRLDARAGKPSTDLTLAYVLLNTAGKPVSSAEKKLSWNPSAGDKPIVTAFSMKIAPGLYQIREAARDNDNGRIGGSYEWIEIPEFAPQHLALSSLLLSERKAASQLESAGSVEDDTLNVARRFSRTSSMLVQTFVYNASRPSGGGTPQVTLQIEIFSRGKVVASSPPNPLTISDGSDPSRIPCAVQLPLKSMAAGLYTLQVTAADGVKNSSVIQSIDFTIE
jgi:VWFA-related protein